MLETVGAASDLFDCRMLAGIFAAARQGIEPAPPHGSSVLSARGLSRGLFSAFLWVLPTMMLVMCGYLQLCHSSELSCILDTWSGGVRCDCCYIWVPGAGCEPWCGNTQHAVGLGK